MKIFIDFDDVIFNTKKFKKDLLEKVFIKNGATKEDFSRTYHCFFVINKKNGKYYDPKKQIKALKKLENVEGEKLEKDFYRFIKDLKRYVFKDVLAFLEKITEHEVFLISYGDPEFQKMKVKGSDVSDFFKKIILGKFNKIDFINNIIDKSRISSKEQTILIDDLPKNLKKKGKFKARIKTFHLRRSEGRYGDLDCEDVDFEVKNLKEAEKIINSLSW